MNDAFTLAPHVQLVDVNTARAIIGRSADTVLEMIEEGRWIKYAFAISAGSRKLRCIRIFRGCLQAWTRKTEHRAELGEVLDAILTTNRPRLRASELVERWSCGHDLLNHLVRGRQLTGAITGHALWIRRQSAARFLEARLIGHAFQKEVVPTLALGFSLGSGVEVEAAEMEEDVGLESFRVAIPTGFFHQALNLVVQSLNASVA